LRVESRAALRGAIARIVASGPTIFLTIVLVLMRLNLLPIRLRMIRVTMCRLMT
jgi:hypothetical protein